jgi:hypothetical protein
MKTNKLDRLKKEIDNLISNYGIKLILEALIDRVDFSIMGAEAFGAESDYLHELKANLTVSLNRYKNRYNEFNNF